MATKEALFEEDIKQTWEEKARVKELRKKLAGHHTKKQPVEGVIQTDGEDFLNIRRLLGIPDPDQKEWGQRMAKYQIGKIALLKAAEHPDYRVEKTHPRLREWLTHPIYDHPATDRDLERLLHHAFGFIGPKRPPHPVHAEIAALREEYERQNKVGGKTDGQRPKH